MGAAEVPIATRRRIADWLVPGIVVVAWAALAHRLWIVMDDAYISFRYGRNLLQGAGLRFSPGEDPPGEGYSDLAWVLISAAVQAAGGDPAAWMPRIAAACGAALIWRVHAAVRARGGDGIDAALAAAWMALLPPFALWSSAGMETMFFALLVWLAWELGGPRGPTVGAALAAALAVITRLEGVAWVGAVALASSTRGRRRRALLATLMPAAVALVARNAWRVAYYQAWLPNTLLAKSTGLPLRALWRGLLYVLHAGLTFPGLCLAPLAALAAWRAGKRAVLGPALVVLAAVGLAVVATGDWMPMARLLVPALPFAALVIGDASASLRARRPAVVALVAAGVVADALPAFGLHAVPEGLRERAHFRWKARHFASEWEVWQTEQRAVRASLALGRTLATRARPGDAVVLGAIGAASWTSDLAVHDQYGLVSPEVARRPVVEGLLSPGHDKLVGEPFFAHENPRWLMAVAATGEGATAQAWNLSARLSQSGLERRWSAVVVPLEGWPGPEAGLASLYERIDPPDTPEAAWARSEAMLRTLSAR